MGKLFRGVNTNNYAETIFKIIKDHLLKRNRLFNPVQLFDFLAGEFNQYFQKKLMEFVTGTRYDKKEVNETIEIRNITSDLVILRESNKLIKFFPLSSSCSCEIGKEGASCSHSYFLSSKNFVVENELCSHIKEVKQLLYFVARGEYCTEIDYYASIHYGKCPSASKWNKDILIMHKPEEANVFMDRINEIDEPQEIDGPTDRQQEIYEPQDIDGPTDQYQENDDLNRENLSDQ